MTTPLSPAAQAVIKKVQATLPDYMISDRTAGFFAAAALRAAADQVVPEGHTLSIHNPSAERLRFDERKKKRAEILTLAAELEGING